MDTLSVVTVAGVLLIAAVAVAGAIAALLLQRVFVDNQGHAVEIELPMLGKLKTNYPAIGALALGLVLSFGVLHKVTLKPDMIPVTTSVLVEHPTTQVRPQVFVGVIPQEYHVVNNVDSGQPKDVTLMVRKGGNYHVVVYTVTGVDENGHARKVVDDGAVARDGKFNARLRLRR